MRILRISGKNLASLAGEFEVDFGQEPLASSGLFAISGPTGAGKSTLLDALCLALYEATPRLLRVTNRGNLLPDVGNEQISPQDPRNLLRRGAAEGHAEVDFAGNDGTPYRARWSVRRARGKSVGGLQPAAMSLHRLSDMQAIGGTRTEVKQEIEQRLGLSFEQFTRAVLLAQNEFSTFLKTEENERGELLETLTGSAVYSEISKRAYERYKLEQAGMQRLNARLADQTPLAAGERGQLDQQGASANAIVATLDARRAVLEQQLRWHQEAARLRRNEELAQEAQRACIAAADAAAPRRRRLATLDAAQSARPLVADAARLSAESTAVANAGAAAEQALARAQASLQASASAVDTASAQVRMAEQAQRAAGPALDRAKALDAGIAALAPTHLKAAQALDAGQRELAQLRTAAAELEARRAALAHDQQSGAGWLGAHGHLQPLAKQWPRWDAMFAEAGQAETRCAILAGTLRAARGELARRSEANAAAATTRAARTQEAELAETARQASSETLAQFDGAAIVASRTALEQRRDRLGAAARTWSELAAITQRIEHARKQAAQLDTANQLADAAVRSHRAQAGFLGAALEQAERSLKNAELACAESVEQLRAALADDQACPVCGSHQHPYQHQDAALHAMLASLRDEVARCRALDQDNTGQIALHAARMAGNTEQLATLRRDVAAMGVARDALAGAWTPDATDMAGLPADDERGDWFDAQLAEARASLQALGAQEQAMRRAIAARDEAQACCDAAARAVAHAMADAAAAQTALAQANAECAACADKAAEAAARRDSVLGELGQALDLKRLAPDWTAAWRNDPAAFHAARRDEAAGWQSASDAHATRAASMLAVELEQRALAAQLLKAGHDAAAAAASFAEQDAALGTMRAERVQLWDGKAAQEIETALTGAIDVARAALASHQQRNHESAQAAARSREALAQAGERLAALRQASANADAQLAAWLARYDANHPGLDRLDSLEQLHALLASGADEVAAERAALAELDAQAASAAVVLRERRSQREQHALAAPADIAATQAETQQALDAVTGERNTAHSAATALQLAIAQDDARRQHAQAMMEEIERQAVIEKRWGSLNELIGSADGKKFRNYAQQFTLDVLLGYANSHLAHLAKRYRLERVVQAATPSLGLMVRDQDMGGELRSVHSLSGGESFLASLALALGLASLSSNRVRVESLFIDEGFGSLDADTLRVAMDALDGLQSMGRKVGVISHVQEMTERISARILVQPSAGGRSTVTVQ